jgi:hypothetical protein
MSGEELAARKEVLESVVGEFHHAYKLAKGHTHNSAEENLGGLAGHKVLGMEDLKRGSFAGAGIKTRKQELTGEQRQVLQEIQGVTKEQDQVLDEISGVIDELKNLAENMQDELQKQNKMLNDLEEKTDKVQTKLDGVNDRLVLLSGPLFFLHQSPPPSPPAPLSHRQFAQPSLPLRTPLHLPLLLGEKNEGRPHKDERQVHQHVHVPDLHCYYNGHSLPWL